VLVLAVKLSTVLPAPGAERVEGVKTAETPVGNPATEAVTAALNPPLTVTFALMRLFDPAVTEIEFAESVVRKLGTT